MRMRKFLAVALSVAMVFSMAACGKKDDTKNPDTNPNVTEAPAENDKNDNTEDGVIVPDYTDKYAGGALWNDFLETMKANPDTSAIDMANKLTTNSVIPFMTMAMEVEPGYLTGFGKLEDTSEDAAEITGFEKGAVYMPGINAIAFIGYVFELGEDADVNAFIKTLKDKAEPRWNRCVSADYVQIGAYENTVYMVMYPAGMDEALPEGDEGVVEDADVRYPDVAENSWGETLWEAFETTMIDNPAATAVDAAFLVAIHESNPGDFGAFEVMPGHLIGFDANQITGFKSGAMFGPQLSSIAFAGYVFELEEGADIDAFMAELKEKCNPDWNECVSAEQTVVGAYNNMVFFLMCPISNQSE